MVTGTVVTETETDFGLAPNAPPPARPCAGPPAEELVEAVGFMSYFTESGSSAGVPSHASTRVVTLWTIDFS